jgi:AAA domain
MLGSGKSTLTHALLADSTIPSFKRRFSIDALIYEKHGIYGVDYPLDRYEELQIEAETVLRDELRHFLLKQKMDGEGEEKQPEHTLERHDLTYDDTYIEATDEAREIGEGGQRKNEGEGPDESADGEAGDVILDLALAFKSSRDAYKRLIEDHGGRWVLVYLDVDEGTLRGRIGSRRERRRREGEDADSAFDMTEEVFQRYLRGFERPKGEGEIVIKMLPF